MIKVDMVEIFHSKKRNIAYEIRHITPARTPFWLFSLFVYFSISYSSIKPGNWLQNSADPSPEISLLFHLGSAETACLPP